MLLGLIFSILSVTYSVASSSSVSVSGEAPINSTADYSRSGTTGQYGQMTAGNSTTLLLSGWEGYTIDSVALSMHSNTSKGSGKLVMYVGERLVWEIANAKFSNKAWNGSYTTNWVNIGSRISKRVGNNEVVKIHIQATENSLYIEDYTIFYSKSEPKAYRVNFISGLKEVPNEMKEEAVGAGVVLPIWPDTAKWRFLGWSEEEVLDEDAYPIYMKAGERYYPNSNCRLWAVYSDGDESLNVSDCQSGEYMIASNVWNVALAGEVVNEEVVTIPIQLDTTTEGDYRLLTGAHDKMMYYVDFRIDNTVTIQHVYSQSAISHEGASLSDNDLHWLYRVLDDGSYCFYYDDGTHQRMLCLGYGKDGSSEQIVAYAIRANVKQMTKHGLLLFPASKTNFTTWPFGKFDAVENVLCPNDQSPQGHYVIHFGQAELHIQNGKKELFIKR